MSQWAVVKETAVYMYDNKEGGERPELGYSVLRDFPLFSSFEHAHKAIAEFNLPLGWVAIEVDQLFPDLLLE